MMSSTLLSEFRQRTCVTIVMVSPYRLLQVLVYVQVHGGGMEEGREFHKIDNSMLNICIYMYT